MSDSIQPMAISTTPLNPPRHITPDEEEDQDDGWGDTPTNTIQTNTDDKPPSTPSTSTSTSAFTSASASTSSSSAASTSSTSSTSTSTSTSTSPTPSQPHPPSDSASPLRSPTTTHTNNMPPPTINPAVLRISQLRLQSDLKALETDPPDGISANPLDPENLYLWRACIFGPEDTPWEGGVFQLRITFPKEYPQKPPTVRFTSKIFHPNVFADGTLCLDIIQDQWSPIYTVSMILTSVQSLLTDPNPASPANPEAAKLLHDDPKEYRKRVRACAAKATM